MSSSSFSSSESSSHQVRTCSWPNLIYTVCTYFPISLRTPLNQAWYLFKSALKASILSISGTSDITENCVFVQANALIFDTWMMIVKSSSLKVPATCYLWLHIELDFNVTSPNNAHYQLLGKPQTRHVCTINVPDAQGLWLLLLALQDCKNWFFMWLQVFRKGQNCIGSRSKLRCMSS